MTRYGKRDHSGFFVESAFLVWIVSVTSPEFNGASLKEKYYSEAELSKVRLSYVVFDTKVKSLVLATTILKL